MAIQDKIYSYFERKPDLRVLFIFDSWDDSKAMELRDIEWKDGYRYVTYDNRPFYIKYALENEWKNDKIILLVRESAEADPRHLSFPLLDVLRANLEFKGESADLFMQERNISILYEPFISRNIQKMQLKKVDKLLQPHYTVDLSEDLMCRAIISADLDVDSLMDWETICIKIISLGRSGEDAKRDKFFSALQKGVDGVKALENKVAQGFGYTFAAEGVKNYLNMIEFMAMSLKYNAICGDLPLIPADVYGQYKVRSPFMQNFINSVWDKAWVSIYAKDFKESMDQLAGKIREDSILKCYGEEAEYLRYTNELCNVIIAGISKDRIFSVPEQVATRLRIIAQKNSDEKIAKAITFLCKVCDYLIARSQVGSVKLDTPKDYVNRYTQELYQLDMYYRQLQEQFDWSNKQTETVHEALLNVKCRIDSDYDRYCNELNLEWGRCLEETGCFPSDSSIMLQQDFYEKTYNDVKQVVIISDAFRYEVAQELMQEMAESIHSARLEPALAMLPTETKYCKAAVFPHQKLSLDKATPTLMVDGKILVSMDDREKHIRNYVPDAICVDYTDIIKKNIEEKREICKHKLVYVFHDTIDKAGHDATAEELSAACRKAINELSFFITHLLSSVNVTKVLVVSDHGFLFNDKEFLDKDKRSVEEDFLEKKTRYYVAESNQLKEGIIKFPLNKVSGMEDDGVFVAVPKGTNRLAASGGYAFAHGGASLQELIIPVISASQRRKDIHEKVGFSVLGKKHVITSSRLKFQLLQEDMVSQEHCEVTVACGLWSNNKLVSKEETVCLNCTDAKSAERIKNLELVLNSNVSSSLLELRVYDIEDRVNAALTYNVTNNTLIERDDF